MRVCATRWFRARIGSHTERCLRSGALPLQSVVADFGFAELPYSPPRSPIRIKRSGVKISLTALKTYLSLHVPYN